MPNARDRVSFNFGLASTNVDTVAIGNGGNVEITAGSLEVVNEAALSASTFGRGNSGNVIVNARDRVSFNFGLASTTVFTDAIGNGGNIEITAGSLEVVNGGTLSASTGGQGEAGKIILQIHNRLQLTDGRIGTFSLLTSGGTIDVFAGSVRLLGNSNILSSVFSGAGGGGNIMLTAGSIIALGDSNILAFAQDGKGGNITLNTRAFFGQNYLPGNPPPFFGNNRVDINASGIASGVITLPDTTFIQNGLTAFSQNLMDSSQLLANSCIVRRNRETGSSFFITGSGGLSVRPGDLPVSSFPTGDVRNVAADAVTAPQSPPSAANPLPDRPWKIGDPIVEPQGVYQLPNGELVLSRECP